MITAIIILAIAILVVVLEEMRYNKVKPADGVRTKIISVPINEWLGLGGNLMVMHKHLVKCADGSIMLPDVDQTRYKLGEIRFEEAYEMNGVVKGRPISTGILYKVFGTIPALLNMNRSKKVKLKKEELPTNMYIQLIKDDGTGAWLTLGNSMTKDYNEVYMYFR